MKTTFIKRISAVWIAFVMLFSLAVPVLANGNGGAAPDKEGYEMVKIEAESLKDGQETQGFLTVTVTETEENEVKSISWTSETPVYFVYVKGGPSGIEKEYGNGATKGSNLTAPDNKGISHVAFYYKQETEEQQNDESEEENSEKEDKNSESEKENGEKEDKNSESEEENGESEEENNESKEEKDGSTKEDKESKENTKENANKSTEIHLHLKNCTAPVEKVEVQLKGDWKEMSNPGNSPLYKLKDGGEFVKDEITAFRLSFESGEKQIYDMDDVKAGNEAEGSINYWLEGCSIEEDENAEEPSDGTEEPGDGTEEPGDGNGDDNGEENGEKSTEIHLHLKNCTAPVESVFVELNGEWVEMSNPGNSPLYKLKDDGEYVKDDITAFKLLYKSGAERFYNLEDIRAGVEAEGSINYWIEDCAVPEDDNTEEPGDGTEEPGDDNDEPEQDGESPDVTEIVKELYITLNLNIEKVVKLTLLINDGENIEFIKINNLWKLIIANGLDVSDIKGIELEFEDGTTKVLLISKLSFELIDQVINLEIDEAVLGIDREEESDEDEGTGKSDNNSENGGDGKQNWYGNVLPKTGESSKMMFYIAGFLLMAAGTGLRMRKPIKY